MYSITTCVLVVIGYLLCVWGFHVLMNWSRPRVDAGDCLLSLIFPVTIIIIVMVNLFDDLFGSAEAFAKWLKNRKFDKS